MTQTIALVTCIDQPALTADDELLGAALLEAGLAWQAVPWNAPGIDWSAFDGILVRSTWDYHQHLEAFVAWTAAIEASGVPLWNAPATLRWNVHKGYLRDLKAAGVDTVQTVWIPRGQSAIDLESIMREQGWHDIVIKPTVSAGGRGVMRCGIDQAVAFASEAVGSAAACDLMIQPFLPAIEQGEISVVMFDGQFSHAVRKLPKAGEYRVQSKFGGSALQIVPSQQLIDQARAALAITDDPLYARVDGLEIDGRFVVMEIEMIEPDLFLLAAEGAAQRLASGVVRRLGEVG